MLYRKTRRSRVLIANFVDGFADGWVFAVGECFREALDIVWTKRTKKGIIYYEWTQGPNYSFSEGDMIYDDPEAYLNWGSYLKKMKRCLQVQAATGCGYQARKGKQWSDGSVWFNVYEPGGDEDPMKETKRLFCTQAEFVTLLKTGNGKD